MVKQAVRQREAGRVGQSPETQSRLHLFLRQHYLHQVTRVYSQLLLIPRITKGKD
jgi:hypothetical protein